MPSPSLFTERFRDVATPMLENQLGFTIVLKVGSKQTEPFVVLASDRERQQLDTETGMIVNLTSREWLLPIASLVIDGEPVVPRAGCRIIDGLDEWEIVPFGGEPAVNKQRYRYLCHSQRVTS